MFWRSSLTNYCKHFPKSICREFISPVGYVFNWSYREGGGRVEQISVKRAIINLMVWGSPHTCLKWVFCFFSFIFLIVYKAQWLNGYSIFIIEPLNYQHGGRGGECNYYIILSDKIKCFNKVAKLIRFQFKANTFIPSPKLSLARIPSATCYFIQNLFLTIYTYKLLQAFSQNICREFISPVGYFFYVQGSMPGHLDYKAISDKLVGNYREAVLMLPLSHSLW